MNVMIDRRALRNAYREHCRTHNRAEFLRIMRAEIHEHFWHLFDETHPDFAARFSFFEGGRGGGRSTNISKSIVSLALDKKMRIVAGRSFQNSILESCKNDIIEQIENMGVMDKFNILRRDGNISCLTTGSVIIFRGFERADKSIKSMSSIDLLWWEEADAAAEAMLEKIEPTIRKKGSRLLFSWNPTKKEAPIERFKEFNRGHNLGSVYRTTLYTDNPWCPPSLKASAELMKAHNYEKYLHVYQGQFYTASENSILGKRVKEKHFDITIEHGDPLIGVDWGFDIDPTVIVECYILGRDLFVRRAASKVGLGLMDTPSWLLKHVPNAAIYTSRADNRGDTIDLCRKQIPLMTKAKKPPGSVEAGISFLQSFDNIFVHPECQKGTAYELVSWEWKLDQYKERTLIPKPGNDHVADAIRYAIYPKMSHNDSFVFA